MATVSLVVPVYHNAASLPELLARFRGLAASLPRHAFEFVFVDDGSGDDSFAVLTRLQATEPRMRVIRLARNFGPNAAVVTGLERARGDAIAALSADLQDPPELLVEMLTHWESGQKVVLAARASREDPWLTRLFAGAFYALFRRLALPGMPAGGFDFLLIDRTVARQLVTMPESARYLAGALVWLGLPAAVVRYHRRAREARFGRSMWGLGRRIGYAADALFTYSTMPLRLVTLAGAALGLGGAACAVLGGGPVAAALLAIGGAQLVGLGVVGEYVRLALEAARGRPSYVVDREMGWEGADQREAA